MSPQKPASRRHFTEAARAAAIAARRHKRELAVPRNIPEIFVVRVPPTDVVFGWEIRRFGAVVLQKSSQDYPTISAARLAGEQALSGFMVNP